MKISHIIIHIFLEIVQPFIRSFKVTQYLKTRKIKEFQGESCLCILKGLYPREIIDRHFTQPETRKLQQVY